MSKKVDKTIEVIKAEQSKVMVFDDHSGKTVEVTQAMQQSAWTEHNRINGCILQIMASLSKIKEERLYLALGFTNFVEYCKSVGFGKTGGYQNAFAGGKMAALGIGPGNDFSAHAENGTADSDFSAHAEKQLEALGARKIYEVMRLAQDQIKQLLTGGEITAATGEKISLEDIRNKSAAETSRAVSQLVKSKKDNQVGKLKADNALLNAEKKALMDQIKSMEKEVTAARTLEDKYGPTDTRLKDKLARLGQAQEHLGGFYRAINKAGVNPEDPADVLDIFSALVGSLERTLEENKPTWHSIILTKEAE